MVPTLDKLAQELIDAIVGAIDGTDTTMALRSCALVAQTFVAPCQRRLFRSIDFDQWRRNLSAIIPRACDVFASSPHLQPYVRSLSIGYLYEDEPPLLISLLRTLRNTEHVVLADGSGLSPGISDLLVVLVSMPHLKSLDITNFTNIPVCIIVHAATTVQRMRLGYISVDTTNYESEKTPSLSTFPLEELTIMEYMTSAQAVAIHPTILPYLRHLRHLDLSRILDVNSPGVHKLVDEVRESLLHLKLEYVLEPDFRTTAVDLPRLDALRSLHIIFLLATAVREPEPLSEVLALLPDFASLPRLEVLAVEISTEGILVLTPPISTFDSALVAQRHLREFRLRLRLRVRLPYRESVEARSQLIHAIRGQLPLANDAGILKIS